MVTTPFAAGDPSRPLTGPRAPTLADRSAQAAVRGPDGAPLSAEDGQIWEAAKALEASFLSVMLEEAGVGEVPSDFGGGEGESHFASFLREEQARGIVDAGGIGLAESLYEAMKGQ